MDNFLLDGSKVSKWVISFSALNGMVALFDFDFSEPFGQKV
jgi:hypothetical protein